MDIKKKLREIKETVNNKEKVTIYMSPPENRWVDALGQVRETRERSGMIDLLVETTTARRWINQEQIVDLSKIEGGDFRIVFENPREEYGECVKQWRFIKKK